LVKGSARYQRYDNIVNGLKIHAWLNPLLSLKAYGLGIMEVRFRILKAVSGKVARLIQKGNRMEYPKVSYVSFFNIQNFLGFPYMRAYLNKI